jgi:parvulin-like peptidyl-prolyl isomerase
MRTALAACLLATVMAAASVIAGDRVVARVGSEAVTHLELAASARQNPDLSTQQVLGLLIERRLVLVWAAGKNISVGDEEVEEVEKSIRERNNLTPDQFEQTLLSRGDSLAAFRTSLREQLIINKAISMALSAKVHVSEEELQSLYLETYPSQTVFEVSHILLTVDMDSPAGDDAAVKEKAAQILARVRDGASFESSASRYSQDTSSADKGGRLGTFREGELLKELEEVVVTLEPGEVGGPVRTSAGYHILKLVSRSMSEPPPFQEVRNTLERSLMAKKEESARTEWLEELKESTYIEVFPDDG